MASSTQSPPLTKERARAIIDILRNAGLHATRHGKTVHVHAQRLTPEQSLVVGGLRETCTVTVGDVASVYQLGDGSWNATMDGGTISGFDTEMDAWVFVSNHLEDRR